MFLHYFTFIQAFQKSFFPYFLISCSASCSVWLQKLSFFFFLMSNLISLFIKGEQFFPHCVKPRQDCTWTPTVLIVSGFKHVQECLLMATGPIFLAGLKKSFSKKNCSWGFFLECTWEQKASEWHAVTCLFLLVLQSFIEKYTCLNH